MRYLNYTILTLALSLGLTGCGENKDTPVQPVANTPAPVVETPAPVAPVTIPATTTVVETATPVEGAKTYSIADVATHNKSNDCWQIVDAKVYDVTSFVPAHPGGPAILKGCGIDATEMFDKVKKHKREDLPKFMVGTLK